MPTRAPGACSALRRPPRARCATIWWPGISGSRRAAELAVEDVQVGAADAARVDLDEHVARAGSGSSSGSGSSRACSGRPGSSRTIARTAASSTLEGMAARTDIFDLDRLKLSSGEGRRLDARGGARLLRVRRHRVRRGARRRSTSTLDVSRMTHDGYSLRLRFSAALVGPCMRCLEAAAPSVDVDAREVDQPGGGEELRARTCTDEELDLGPVGARRLRARAARPGRLPRGLRRPVPGVRREPQRRSRARARARARPALGQAARAAPRVAQGRPASTGLSNSPATASMRTSSPRPPRTLRASRRRPMRLKPAFS